MRLIQLVVALALGACAKEAPPMVTVAAAEPPPLVVAVECAMDGDPQWLKVSEGAVRRSTAARNYKLNENRFAEVIKRRRICWASLQGRTNPTKSQ